MYLYHKQKPFVYASSMATYVVTTYNTPDSYLCTFHIKFYSRHVARYFTAMYHGIP